MFLLFLGMVSFLQSQTAVCTSPTFEKVLALYQPLTVVEIQSALAIEIWQDYGLNPQDETCFYESLQQAIDTTPFSPTETFAHSSALLEKIRLEWLYGDQALFTYLMKLGSNLVVQFLQKEESPLYEKIMAFLAFHRHMMAQVLHSEQIHLFGKNCRKADGGWAYIKTPLFTAFPKANAYLIHQFVHAQSTYLNWNLQSAYEEENEITLVKKQITLTGPSGNATREEEGGGSNSIQIPLAVLLTLKEEPTHPRGLAIAAEIFGKTPLGSIPRTQRVVVLHGGEWFAKERRIHGPWLQTAFLEIKARQHPTSTLLPLVARVAIMECHFTFVCRGGGSIPEMLIEGFLLHLQLASLLEQRDFILWEQAMRYSDTAQFQDIFCKLFSSSTPDDL